MEEITFQVQPDEQSGCLVAWWDDSDGAGRITTQGNDLRDLQQQVTEAVAVHFHGRLAPPPADSASTSSAILSWFRREAATGRFGSGGARSPGAAGLPGYQTNRLSCSL